MNTIHKITRKSLLNEVAGISFIVREWAKILIKEVAEQSEVHKKAELEKTKKEEPKKIESKKFEKESDPFYWEDETSMGKGSSGEQKGYDHDEWDWSLWKKDDKKWREKGSYYKKSYSEKDYEDYRRERGSRYGGSYSSYVYTPPLTEVIVDGKKYPEQYKKFSVDKWVMKNSGRIEYDHWHSGYENGEYVVYLNIPINSMSEGAFIHEIKHAYDDWNRMKSGGKPIRDSWEIKNIYTPDFEKLVLGGSSRYPQLGPLIRYFYLGSKLETPAYLENEYDSPNAVGYEDIGRKLKNFTISNYFNKQGEPAKGLENEFKELQKLNIPIFKKYKNVTEFLNWVKKYFNKRGDDIYRRVIKMKAVHDKPINRFTPQEPKYTYTAPTKSTYTPPKEKEPIDIKKYEEETGESADWGDFEEGETMGDWKFSKERGWYFDGEDDGSEDYYRYYDY